MQQSPTPLPPPKLSSDVLTHSEVPAAAPVWDAPLGPAARVNQDASEPLPLAPPLTARPITTSASITALPGWSRRAKGK